MPKTVVGLFEKAANAEATVSEIEALGFPSNEVRTLEEPETFEVTGVMSFPRIDFEVDLMRALSKIGATEGYARAYLEGLRRGGALVFATGPDAKVDAAASVMTSHGAVQVEASNGTEPELPHASHANMTPLRDSPIVAGRIQQPGDGPAFFTW